MGRKAVLTAEERKQHRRASARKWYQAHKAKNAAGKPRKSAKHAVKPRKAAKTAKKTAKPRKASNRLLGKLGKLIKRREDLKASLLTVADEIKACKAQIKAAK